MMDHCDQPIHGPPLLAQQSTILYEQPLVWRSLNSTNFVYIHESQDQNIIGAERLKPEENLKMLLKQ